MSNATQTFREERQPLVREVQRKANAGERIKIVNACDLRYKNGDEFVVVRSYDMGVYAGGCGILNSEYVVLEPIAPSTAPLPDLFAQFIRDNAGAVRDYLAEVDPVDSVEPNVEENVSEPQLTRAKVIEMARERAAELGRIGRDDDARLEGSAKFRGAWFEIDFVVNRDKRAITALVYKLNGFSYKRESHKPDAVGIAKCAPDDVFNADIGKAIAAERALGLTLTSEFVNTPKPDKAVPGVIIRKVSGAHIGTTRVVDHTIMNGKAYAFTNGFNSEVKNCAIIDDTDAIYGEEREAA